MVYKLPKGVKKAMTTAAIQKDRTTENSALYETPEEAKARRNAEYLAKLDLSIQQIERGEVVSMTFAEWEEWIKNV